MRHFIGKVLGRYRLSMMSGVLTGVAAGDATLGHLFSFTWWKTPGYVADAVIHRIKLRWQTRVAFTAAQELGFEVFRLTGYSAAHTGGTPAVKTAPNLKKSTSYPATELNDARIGTTGALTAGTHVLDSFPIGGLNLWSQAGAAPNVLGGEAVLEADRESEALMVLQHEQGFIVRNKIGMGAGGDGRLLVEADWCEVAVT